MNFSSEALVLMAMLPLLAGVLLQLLASRLLSSRAKGVLALVSCLPSFVAVVATFVRVNQSGPIDFTALPWDGPLALVFHVDALSLMFALMGTALGAAVLLYSIGYMAHDRSATRFYAFMLTFICGMVGLVYSANLFFLYLCWEAMGLCSFSLVGFWYEKKEAVAGARKVLLMTHLAGYGLLAAILLIFARTGSALWTDPAVAQAFTGGVFALMLVALVAKSVQFPLHTWIPEAMNAPTPVSALLHAACYVKAGVYLAARMHSFNQWPASWGMVMMWIGTVTMVVGVVYAMVQHDLKRMLAFHTVSQIGYIITGLGIGTPLAIAAALLHCLNHSLFKGGLFLAAGSVQHAAGTRDMNELGGLARKMPQTSIVWLISVGAMMGVPFMSGFASKWLLYTAALQAGQVVPALAAWVVSVGTVFSCVKATSSVFLGPTTPQTENAHESSPTMVWAMGLFALGSVVIGLAPQLAVDYVINPILPVLGLATVQVSWFGLTPNVGSMWTMGGLVLAVVSAGVGALVYAMAGMSRTRILAAEGGVVLVGGTTGGGGASVFTGGESISGSGHLPAGEFSVILKKYWAPFYRYTNVDHLYLSVWTGLQALSSALGRVVAWAEKYMIAGLAVLTVVLICALRWFAPAVVQSGAVESVERIPVLLAAGCAVALGALLWAAAAQKAWGKLVPLLALGGASAVAAGWTVQPIQRMALLEIASAVLLLLVWRVAVRRAAWSYTVVVALSAVSLVAGQVALQQGSADWARALLLGGFILKLAIVPLLLWLPAVAEAVPALVMGVIVAVVDIAAFGELYLTAVSHPELLSPSGLWIAIAVASSLLASLLMLTVRNMKRLLALSTIEDMGFLLLGIASASELGLQGALFAATVHALAKALLFICLSAPEADGALTNHARGLATRYPVSAAGFLVGMLAMLGVPPLLGFAGRWRLYQTAAGMNHWLLAGFIISSMFALIAYVLCLTRCWWGPRDESDASTYTPETLPIRLAVVGLIVVLLAGGLWPDALLALTRGIQ
ncbi:MAG: proton-conducting transporter membrane subunit [Terracidiphilus sp.]|nr:proton-conducting transporter membrane subunit [Terracidiphilus sp.]